MDVPKFHRLEADAKSFMEGVCPQIHQKLVEEILTLKGVQFQLALKVLFRKGEVDKEGKEWVYMPAVLRHKQEAIFQAHEIDGALDTAFPYILETLEKWMSHGSGWEVDRVELLCSQKQESSGQCEEHG